MAIGGPDNAKLRVGRAQAKRVQERPPEAPFGRRLSNADTLKLSKAAAKNLIAGTIEKNKAAADKAAKIARNK
jgi:hypothetical protein